VLSLYHLCEKSWTLHHHPASAFIRDEMAAVAEVMTAVVDVTAVAEMMTVVAEMMTAVSEEWQERWRGCEFVETLYNVSNSSYKKIRL